MGKKESIVPGLGKKQIAVLQNRHARQLEHKRHLEELGFPEYVEPDFVRHAPVSYDDENPTPSKIVNQAGQDLGDPNKEESAHFTQNHYKIKKDMKKTRYPDVRIEIISSGLMDKLLGRSQQKPSVVGEEKPTGQNLPDIKSKRMTDKLLSRFTRGSKKPTYTSIFKEWLAKEEEGGMARAQLDRVSDLADMAHNVIEEEDELPGWVQNKISDSLHNLEATFSSLNYDEKKELGLRKSIERFKSFLVKAPKKGADSRLKQAGVVGTINQREPLNTQRNPTLLLPRKVLK